MVDMIEYAFERDGSIVYGVEHTFTRYNRSQVQRIQGTLFRLGRDDWGKKSKLASDDWVGKNSLPPYVTFQDIVPWLNRGHKIRDLIVISSGR